ncbi:MAG: DUF362 domain-containing protein [Deltaproteobacteria bacterium]|nr:DUF362 domain-containing protein [Deltaproteobacteria bacterium]
MKDPMDRRSFLGGIAAGAAAVTASQEALGQHRTATGPSNFRATPPAGFTPMTIPGRVVRVNKAGSLRPGGLFPRPEAARAMVHRAVQELSGQPDMAQAWRAFVHPSDRVAIKVNGLGLRNMSSNKETVEAIVEGVIAAGVPAAQVSIYEQWDGFLSCTRLNARGLPAGVRLLTHGGTRLSAETRVASGRTWYATALLEATAVIGVPLVKDHSLCGFTGAMKNMTHGSIKNPEAFHRHLCSPQIAELFAHDAIRSRSRLHVMDAFKALYHGGPRDNPSHRVPFEAVMVSTDPVALDRIGAEIVDQLRTAHHMTTLAQRGLPPRYLESAQTLGLGISDRARIDLRVTTMT